MKPPREKPYPCETDLARGCIRRVRGQWGGAVFKVHGNAVQESGHPDLIGCLNGRMFGIELKQPGHKPTPLQYKRLREWAAAGGLAGWATTEVELDELLAHAHDLGWVNPQLDRESVGAGV